MTEPKWTKGPWRVVVDEEAAQVKGFPCIEAEDYEVVGTEGMYGDLDTDYANAHLIAAAPDLYEALDWSLRAIATFMDDPSRLNDMDKAITARAALAKAKAMKKGDDV